MDTFPNITPPTLNDFEEETYCPAYADEFENGAVQSRPKWTGSTGKKRWVWAWAFLPEAEYLILTAFFQSHTGQTFLWTDWKTGVEYTVWFRSESIKGRIGDDPDGRIVPEILVEER